MARPCLQSRSVPAEGSRVRCGCRRVCNASTPHGHDNVINNCFPAQVNQINQWQVDCAVSSRPDCWQTSICQALQALRPGKHSALTAHARWKIACPFLNAGPCHRSKCLSKMTDSLYLAVCITKLLPRECAELKRDCACAESQHLLAGRGCQR